MTEQEEAQRERDKVQIERIRQLASRKYDEIKVRSIIGKPEFANLQPKVDRPKIRNLKKFLLSEEISSTFNARYLNKDGTTIHEAIIWEYYTPEELASILDSNKNGKTNRNEIKTGITHIATLLTHHQLGLPLGMAVNGGENSFEKSNTEEEDNLEEEEENKDLNESE
jgi:hypothetical protein